MAANNTQSPSNIAYITGEWGKPINIMSATWPSNADALVFDMPGAASDTNRMYIDFLYGWNGIKFPNVKAIIFRKPLGTLTVPNGIFPNMERVEGENIMYKDGMLLSADGKCLLSCMNVRGQNAFRIPEGVEDIKGFSVCYAQADKLILPDSVKRIAPYAFWFSKFSDIRFPKDLDRIPQESFMETQITRLNIPARIKAIEGRAFCNSEIKEISFEEGIERIDDNAFAICTTIERVTLPKSLKHVGYGNFQMAKEIVQLSDTPVKGLIRASLLDNASKDTVLAIVTPSLTLAVPTSVDSLKQIYALSAAWDKGCISMGDIARMYLIASNPGCKMDAALETVARGFGSEETKSYIKRVSAKMVQRYLKEKNYVRLSKLMATNQASAKALAELRESMDEISDLTAKAYFLNCLGKKKSCAKRQNQNPA